MRREALIVRVFRRALVDSIPVAMGYITMGIAAGVLLAKKGGVPMPALWSGLTALTSLSGTLQFVIVDCFRSAAPPLAVAGLTFAISFRYGLYGFSLLERFREIPLWKKLYLIEGLTDETFALECGCGIEDRPTFLRYCLTLTALNQGYWVFGTVTGAVLGAELPIPSKGIEFAMVALFIVILADQARGLFAFAGRRGGALRLFLCSLPFFAAMLALRAPAGGAASVASVPAAAWTAEGAWRALGTVLTAWAVIYLLRAFPFILFGRAGAREPRWLAPMAKWISPATIAMLIVYSYWGLSKARPETGALGFCVAGVAAGVVTAAVHLLRRNALLSILAGTVLYMILVR